MLPINTKTVVVFGGEDYGGNVENPYACLEITYDDMVPSLLISHTMEGKI